MLMFHFKNKEEFYERIADGSLQKSMMEYLDRSADMELPVEEDTLLYNFEAEFEIELENGKRYVSDEDVATEQGEIGKLLHDMIVLAWKDFQKKEIEESLESSFEADFIRQEATTFTLRHVGEEDETLEYVFLGIISVAVIAVLAFSLIKPTSSEAYEGDEIIAYVKDLENRLEKTLSKVKGAGEVSVVITVDSGKETVLASEKVTVTEDGRTTVTESPIMVNGKPVVLKENYPEIVGVLIVAQGANSISVMKFKPNRNSGNELKGEKFICRKRKKSLFCLA